MSLPLPEYRVLRPLRESARSRVYEAIRERDGHVVIAKVFDIAGEGDEDRVRREFELIRSLDAVGVVQALDLLRVGNQLVLLLECVVGENLAEFTRGLPLPLETFWPIAIQLSEILARTHAARVIHRDIKPTNILIEHGTGRVYLADFGISLLLEHEHRHIYDSDVFIGTLPYISPEQTGRTSRTVDARSDLYSLGVTFYELLTGCRPFENLGPLDLIHAHLAREPTPPIALRPDVPPSLSRLVMKLLAKAPEHRYQTATGLAADLERLQASTLAGDDTAVELGRDDVVTTLRLPHQLYGRAREWDELLAAFKSVVTSGGRQAMVVTGPAGIGKSALIGELLTEVTGRGGYQIRSEFIDGELPLSGLARALTALFEQLLTESDARLDRWRRLLMGGLGNLAGVITELCPSFELIVGAQAPAPNLDALAAGNRLLVALERLLAVVCASGPLVLVLDDLQHAGLGAARLLDSLVGGRIGPLLVILAWRDDAIGASHPLRGSIDELLASAQPRRLALEPLPVAAVARLIGAALPGATDLHELAQAITRRTHGVPLFVRQLLTQLFEHRVLRATASGWAWDRLAVEAEPLPDDVIALMQAKLASLPVRTREVIARAACIGSRFELGHLASICELARAAVAELLADLEELGMVARAGSSYRFAHDSIRAAAYADLDDTRRRRLHWQLGQRLRATIGDANERLFELVDHLEAGQPASLTHAERIELATLQLRAAEWALANAAHDLAERHAMRGVALLDDHDALELTFELHFIHARALMLGGRRPQADGVLQQLLAWPLPPHQYAAVVGRRLELLWVEGRQAEAVEFGLAALAQLGAPVPRPLDRELAISMLRRTWQAARSLDRAAIDAMPRCRDRAAIGIIEVTAQLEFTAFVIDIDLLLFVVSRHVELLLEHGRHVTIAKALSDLALVVGGALDEVEDSVRMHALALELAAAEPHEARATRILAIGGPLTLHRGQAFADIITQFDAAYPQALEAGEFDAAGFLGGFGADMQLEIGVHLRVVERRCRQVVGDVGRWCPIQMRVELALVRGVCRALADGQPPDDDAVWNLDPEQVWSRQGARTNYHAALVHASIVALVLGDTATSLTLALRMADTVERAVFNSMFVARAWLLLAAADAIERLAGETLPPMAAAAAEAAVAKLQRWAAGSPSNYGHYLDFALGLRHAVAGRSRAAVVHLDRAWASARQRGCRWIEGLAAEQLAAEFERQGLRAPVEGVLQRAWEAFAAWGAEAKLMRLRATHPTMFPEHGPRSIRPGTTSESDTSSLPHTNLSGTPTHAIDLARVLHSVGSISEELRLDEVIARVLEAAMTLVGADHGLLVLDQGGELVLVADADSLEQRRIYADPLLLRDAAGRAPVGLINFVARTGQSVVLDDAREDLRFAGDHYLEASEVRSILALPMRKGERRLGVLVLENHLTTHGFAATSIEALRMITSQAASTLENAQLYAALRRSEARWRSLVDGAPDLIALLDERGAVVFRNHSGPLQGIDDTDEPEPDGALEPESSARWREAVLAVLGDGERRELELVYEPTHGPKRWYAVRVAPIELHRGLGEQQRGHHRNAVAVATDISATKLAELEKRALEAQLRQQQRLESLGTLASGVAHEINNPIQGVLNYAELIRTNLANHELVEDFATEIEVESHRVAKIVRNLLAFSRRDASEGLVPSDLAEVVESSLSLIHSVLRGDHITVQVSVDEAALAPVRCRAQQIQQIIMNLVTNARDALNQRYGPEDERKRIEIQLGRAPRAGWLRLSVRDSGGGIPAEVLPRIFDPFFTTKGRDRGTGLGLAVSHGIAQEHGGELSVDTVPGEGTCFMLDLPC